MTNFDKYWSMWKAWKVGAITREEWMAFCVDFLTNEILTDPDIVEIMKRLKDR